MKILITGAKGQLGYHLQQTFAEDELYLGDTDNYDITNRDIVMRETENFKPNLIIHGAAYTNVDGAEANKELCRSINVDGSRNVAEATKAVGAKILAISTDYVFAGDKGSPYTETDRPNPLSFYGQTKYEGEQAIQQTIDRYFICRTSWLYGGPKPAPQSHFEANDQPRNPDSRVARHFGIHYWRTAENDIIEISSAPFKNFVYTMLKVGKDKAEVEVVSDQKGAPTYAKDFADTIKQLVTTDKYGIYHATNSGVTNWADFAQEIFRLAHYDIKVKGITSEVWASKNPQATKRPAYSVLAHQALLAAGLPELRSWQEAVREFLSEFS